MKISQKVLAVLPNYYLLLLLIAAAYRPPFHFNPLFLSLTLIPILQFLFENKIMGSIMSFLFLFANLIFILALISELSEFNEFNESSIQLLFVGTSICLMNSLVNWVMFKKYLIKI